MKYIKYVIGIAIVLVIGMFIGVKIFSTTRVVAGAVNPIGTTNATPRIAQIVANPTPAYSATTNGYLYATLPNPDANDRVINSIDYVYTVLGTNSSTTIAALNLQSATSSDITTLNSNTNLVVNTTIATSSVFLFTASSTPGLTSTNSNRIWQAGSNLNFIANGTTTGSVIIRVSYIAE